jgi:UDP-N-acetylmuramoyl-tripeptide--D-alanyl-D-alanine ligase
VILGEMKELGAYSKEEHQQLIDRLSASGLDKVFLCGESFAACRSIPSDWRIFPQTTDLLTYLPTADISGYYILIKGSRTNRLEKTTAFL